MTDPEKVAYFITDKWGGYWQTVVNGNPYTFRLGPSTLKPEGEQISGEAVGKPVICIGRHTVDQLMAGQTVEIDAAIMIPASELTAPVAAQLRDDPTLQLVREAAIRRCIAVVEGLQPVLINANIDGTLSAPYTYTFVDCRKAGQALRALLTEGEANGS